MSLEEFEGLILARNMAEKIVAICDECGCRRTTYADDSCSECPKGLNEELFIIARDFLETVE